jgi:hypothetical protein
MQHTLRRALGRLNFAQKLHNYQLLRLLIILTRRKQLLHRRLPVKGAGSRAYSSGSRKD